MASKFDNLSKLWGDFPGGSADDWLDFVVAKKGTLADNRHTYNAGTVGDFFNSQSSSGNAITRSTYNENPFSDYREQKILSGVPRQSFSGGQFDNPTVNDGGVMYYDTNHFFDQVRGWAQDRNDYLDSGNMKGARLHVDEGNSTSDFLRMIRQSDDMTEEFYDVRMDRQTGAMSVNNALSPSGGYFATASAELDPKSHDLENSPFKIKNATEVFHEALIDPRGPVVGLQQNGGLYRNYEELTPQWLANTKASIYMPGVNLSGEGVQMRERIELQDRLQEQVNMRRADFSREHGVDMTPALLRVKDDSNHLIDINRAVASEAPMDAEGTILGVGNAKRMSLQGRYEMFKKLSMDGERMQQMQMSMNLTDATDAPIGYPEMHRNRLAGDWYA